MCMIHIGTGHVDYSMFGDSSVLLTVLSEDANQELLVHRVQASIDYQRQEKTIITWCEPDTGIDLALSFQQDIHCNEVWDQISTVLQRLADAAALDLEVFLNTYTLLNLLHSYTLLSFIFTSLSFNFVYVCFFPCFFL